jgi:hypothetical protein
LLSPPERWFQWGFIALGERNHMSTGDGEQPGSPVDDWIPPMQYFAPVRPRPDQTPTVRLPVVAPAAAERAAPRRGVRIVLAGAAALSALVAAGLAYLPDERLPRAAPVFVGLPPDPVRPILPGGPSSGAPQPSGPPTSDLVTTDVRLPLHTGAARTTAPGAARPATSSASVPAPILVPGDSIGLAPAGMPGLRVRHRDFRAWIDPVGPRSSALDHADSRFTVRRGRASAACASLESANYPGYFLRHRDYLLRLERADGSALFDADATFCPVPAAGGFVLRSHNYPDRYVTARREMLSVTGTRFARAVTFVVARPY